jgi:nuclear migration protein JNM1
MPPSLVSSLSKLEHQLQLLTQPRHLDTVARRVKTLVGDLERVHEARRKLGDTRPLNVALGSGITVVSDTAGPSPDGQTAGDLPPDALQKIDALSALLPRLEPLLPLAPALLARLRTLAPLHGAAADFGASLAEVRREAATVREAEGGLREALEGLERSFDANERTVKGNLEALEGRMKALGPRLEALGVAA